MALIREKVKQDCGDFGKSQVQTPWVGYFSWGPGAAQGPTGLVWAKALVDGTSDVVVTAGDQSQT